jgi:hypothetical protein
VYGLVLWIENDKSAVSSHEAHHLIFWGSEMARVFSLIIAVNIEEIKD